jgi:hypothetical protein
MSTGLAFGTFTDDPVQFEPPHRVGHVIPADDAVSDENRPCFVAANFHSDAFRYASVHEVPDGRDRERSAPHIYTMCRRPASHLGKRSGGDGPGVGVRLSGCLGEKRCDLLRNYDYQSVRHYSSA